VVVGSLENLEIRDLKVEFDSAVRQQHKSWVREAIIGEREREREES
jgi:hypothetical protein